MQLAGEQRSLGSPSPPYGQSWPAMTYPSRHEQLQDHNARVPLHRVFTARDVGMPLADAQSPSHLSDVFGNKRHYPLLLLWPFLP